MSESMFMAVALNPPKNPSKSTSHPLFRLPQPPPHSLSNQTTISPHSPPPHNHNNKNTPLCSTLFATAHARTKCSNPSEPPPPSTASPKQIFTIRFLPSPPKPGESAFDRILASIPFKGQVLNQTSLWWFERTQHITANAVVSTPDPNVTIAKKYSVFPVEFVARGFVIGSTDTSLWTVYNKGIRNYCGNALPDGLVKNQKLAENILTPTTKAADHDVPVTPDEIIERGLMTRADYEEVSKKALSLFEYGQCVASEHGLILVDTKYEFGKAEDGSIMLTDEVHTPDPSRYWIANSYLERFQNGLEPENVDKEFLRLWFKNHCNPYEDEVLPEAPEDLVCELSWRYIFLYETITKSKFEVLQSEEPIHEQISRNVASTLASLK
ncbi:hypothetical protein S83_036502 [Arachis hypogaea]